jgi:hypothetical protein
LHYDAEGQEFLKGTASDQSQERTDDGVAAVRNFVHSSKTAWRHLPGAAIVAMVLIFLVWGIVKGSWIYKLLSLLLLLLYLSILDRIRRADPPVSLQVDPKILKIVLRSGPPMLFELNKCLVQPLRWPSSRFLLVNGRDRCIISPEDFEQPEELLSVFNRWIDQQAQMRFADGPHIAAINQKLERSRWTARLGSGIFVSLCVFFGALFQTQHMPNDAAKMFALAVVSCLISGAIWLIQRTGNHHARNRKS